MKSARINQSPDARPLRVKTHTAWYVVAVACACQAAVAQDELPPISESHKKEAAFYKIVDLPIENTIFLEAGSFESLPDKRMAIGTRRGEIYFVDALIQETAFPKYQLFASGLHEVLGLAWYKGSLYATQQCEVTRITDTNNDGRADKFETINDDWGFGGEHEFTYGSKFDREGNLWTVHCLTGSYTSEHKFRGWCLRTTADGKTVPTCSGLRSPGGIGTNATGDMFYTENQGPWNGACSLKHLRPKGFLGHPISFPWYKDAPNMGPVPAEPKGGREQRQHMEAARIPELVPPAVVFPYRKMGQSASFITTDLSNGKFGPFAGQTFVGDYTLSLVMRVQTELVDGVYQGACFPFREGFKTGLIGGLMTKEGYLFVGGCSRGWPARGPEPFRLQRLDWTGETPFEIQSMRLTRDGFELRFTEPVDPETAGRPASYTMTTFTHHYAPGYGSPEVDQATATIREARVGADRESVRLIIDGLKVGHIHELSCAGVRDTDGGTLLHQMAWYTLNRLRGRD